MSRTLGLIFRELLFRRANMLLTVSALAATVAVCIATAMTLDAARRESKKLTLKMGFNLRIIPSNTNETEFLLRGYSAETMPLDIVHRLAANDTIVYNHLVATLKREVKVDGKPAILTGLGDTLFPPGKEKPPMHAGIQPGTAELGHTISEQLGLKKGDTITVADVSLKVARVNLAVGKQDDLAILVNLADAQQILNAPDQINEIQAIDCLCLAADEKPQDIIRREVERVAPEAKVVMLTQIADARARIRRTVERYAMFALPLLLVVSTIWVGSLAMLNVRQRRTEIGLLKALGYRGSAVAGLFLGRAVILGLVAAALGYAIGTVLGLGFGPKLFPITAKAIHSQPLLALWALLTTPVLAAIASLVPAALASTQDPAVALRTE